MTFGHWATCWWGPGDTFKRTIDQIGPSAVAWALPYGGQPCLHDNATFRVLATSRYLFDMFS